MKANEIRVITKDFQYRGEHYSIVKEGEYYMTINHKFIDADGKTTKVLNYTDGLHTASSVAECIEATKNDLDMRAYMAEGMTKAEAMTKIFNIPIEIAEMAFTA